jgi:Leucine-rich repeat (LRR) protein
MKRWITIYFVLHWLCYVNSTNKLDSSYVSTQQKAECVWRRTQSTAQNAVESSDNRFLSCRIKTISGLEGLIRNLTATSNQNQVVNSLKLECSDVLFAESSLDVESEESRSRDFGAFNKHLHELAIQYCKIKYVPSTTFKSFKNLKSLTLQTHNADWSTINLELHPETFSGLSELRSLNLADNNIWTVPNGVFCPLYSLRYLNLSKNHINDISQIGFAENEASGVTGMPPQTCNTGLEQLDLSYNNLISIPNNCFTALRSLNFLHLDSNQLTILDDNSFEGMEKLMFLNISNNRLIALPPELFEKTKELKRLYIGNNSLAVLAPGLFEKLQQLEVLDLSFNELTSSWINRDTFVGLTHLILLKLNSNKLTKIDQFVFRELYGLRVLNLESNSIEIIAQNAFSDLTSLRQLLLSNNNLKTIESKHFAGLTLLNQLILESNEISIIHPNAFDNLTNVVDLSLNDNKLNKIPDSIRKLRNLQALDLGKNQITSVDSDSFDGLEELTGLRLTDNQISSITKGAFVALKSIHVLNFASNKIKHIDQSAFLSNEKLRAIRLDCNSLEDISSVFTSLSSLVLLNVSNNNLKWFDFSHLPQSLEWLDIHNNNITELGNYFDVTSQLKINYLDVSNNKIRKIKNDLIPKNITTINLNNNLIDDIPSGTFLNKKHIRKIHLVGNMIKKLQITSLIVAKFDVNREAPELYLAGNPLHCDCHMEWLRNINELSEQRRQLPKLMDMSKIKCTMEHNHEHKSYDDVAIKPFFELNSNDFLCRYENHCHTLCQCCRNDEQDDDDDDVSECKCKMTCPDQCSCYHDNTWNKNIVDCANSNLQSLPLRIPIDVTTFYIDGNNLTHLSHHQFAGKNRLEILYANGSNIHSIANNTFDELKNLRVLHLNNNQLKKLHGYEFKEQALLNELYLDHNRLTHIGENSFNHMKFLRTISLSDNKLIDFNPIHQLSAASKSGVLSQVFLDGDNKWNCDCKSLVQLIEWIKHRSNNFNVNRMLCVDNRIVGDVLNNCHLIMNYNTNYLGNGNNNELATPSSSLNSLQQQHSTILFGGNHHPFTGSGGFIPLFAAVLVTIITLALLIALVCIFRQDVKLWAYSKYGVRLFGDGTKGKKHLAHRCNHPNEHTNDDECYGEKIYDAYFVYSINDTDLLTQILLPELQNIGYNISMYNHLNKPVMSRDNYQITNFLIDQLKSATEVSQRMAIVVSFNFLQNEWCDPNFRCALQSVIESMNRINKNIIIILTVPVQLIQMDPVLQLLIRTCTVICWGEKRFWSKLRYALPDVSKDKKFIEGSKYGENVNHTFANLRYTTAPTSTLQSTRTTGPGPYSANNPHDWYNLSPVGYSMPINQYQQPQYCNNENEMPNNLRRSSSQHSPYDYEQPEYNAISSRGAQSIGGSSQNLGHLYATIPETPPLSSSSNASSPSMTQKPPVKHSHLIEQQHCDSSNNDHFV